MANPGTELTFLSVERPSDGVVVLRLNDPDRRNVMSDDMTESWGRALTEIKADPSVRVVVVTGAGTAFSSGGNTGWIASEPDATVDYLRTRMIAFYRAWLAIRDLEVPTIAAINGPAVGAGLCLALACDIRYASESARMSAPFVKLGMHPGMAATYLLADVVGNAQARELMLTGRMFGADEALRLGAVSRVFPDEEFAAGVDEIARGIAGNAPIATRYTKVAMLEGHADFETSVQWEALAQPITLATEDLQEGIAAARAKRPPVFRGV